MAAAWSYLGRILRYRGEPAAAEEAYTKAIEFRQNNTYDYYGRALALLAQDKLDDALKDAKAIGARNARDPRAKYIEGLGALKRGKIEQG